MGRTGLSGKELSRVEVLGRVKSGELKLVEASELMEVSYRQAKRIWKMFQSRGAAGLQHGNCGRGSNRAYKAEFRARVMKRVRERYADFGATLASEHLAEEDGLKIGAETLRRWQRAEGLGGPRRKRRAYRKRRERKAHFGEMVQLDASFHRWLEERGERGCLMHMIDDATGRIELQFSEGETTWAAARILRRWIEQYGIPHVLYTDWDMVYVSSGCKSGNRAEAQSRTQFGRMCQRLGIRIIAANSPQAKGRVERGHGTHQDRLIKKLRLKAITDYGRANQYLASAYITEHNGKFARAAASALDYHRAIPSAKELDEVFALEQERVISNDWVVSYGGQRWQLERQCQHYAPVRSRVLIREWEDGTMVMLYRGRSLHFHKYEEPVAVAPVAPRSEPVSAARRRHRPAAHHPWNRKFNKWLFSSTNRSPNASV